jgi:ubiquinone biosynthesis protein COQ4
MLTLTPEFQMLDRRGLMAFQKLSDRPGDLEAVYDLADSLANTPAYERSREALLSQPEIKSLVDERYLPVKPDFQILLSYPAESLGYTYASHLQVRGFDPDFYRDVPIEDDASYIALRLRQTHDIYHVITGFDTDIMGEIGLQAFQLAQTRSPLSLGTIGTILVHFLNSDRLPEIMDIIHIGWQMGVTAKPFLCQKWEEDWLKSVANLQRELNIIPVGFN